MECVNSDPGLKPILVYSSLDAALKRRTTRATRLFEGCFLRLFVSECACRREGRCAKGVYLTT